MSLGASYGLRLGFLRRTKSRRAPLHFQTPCPAETLLSLCCHDDDTPPLPPPPSSPVLLLTLSVSLRLRSVPLPALLIGNYSFWLLPPRFVISWQTRSISRRAAPSAVPHTRVCVCSSVGRSLGAPFPTARPINHVCALISVFQSPH